MEFNVRDFGAVGDGTTDDTQAIRAAFNVAKTYSGSTLYFPKGYANTLGSYKITDTLDFRSATGAPGNRVNLRGDGPDTTRIVAETGFGGSHMLRMGVNAPSPLDNMVGGISIEGISFYSAAGIATNGIELTYVNYSNLANLEFQNLKGTAIRLARVEDTYFENIQVRKCGKWVGVAGNFPALLLTAENSLPCNSIVFQACNFERNDYAGAFLSSARSIKFLGCKFHGFPTVGEKPTTNAPLLLWAGAECDLLQVIGCQFVYANKYAINLVGKAAGSFKGDFGGTFCATIVGNTFNTPSSFGTTLADAVWNIRVAEGLHSIDSNIFMEVLIDDGTGNPTTNDSYRIHGGDITVATTSDGVTGTNYHLAQLFGTNPELRYVSYTGTGNVPTAVRPLDKSFFDIRALGKHVWGDGKATGGTSVTLERNVDGTLSGLQLGTNNHLKLDGKFDGGFLRLKNSYLWVDASGKLRIITGSQPTSDTSGFAVGTQT